ncbi:response regulator [Franconibacter pulveris 1160]|jgi:two-component system response regulator BasR|uniref:XRE family transcriptional regulator n=1 Tax=Franconibacter pulveris TaxID=435910 RepID=A0A0J8VQH7_9ENTR|nr:MULTISPECIES: response regulator [Franconibacter]KMV34760.1 XRE family transcriptional regulator [Franconibacter pulveris]MEB5921839.1 response regulator [Franconibacter daqui]
MNLLIVEDDLPLQESMEQAFVAEGDQPVCAASAAEADILVQQHVYGLIILDLSLPDRDGIALLAQWRRSGVRSPVLILTEQGALAERVYGLDAGADDYLTKPFEHDELWGRVQSILRRYPAQTETVTQPALSSRSEGLTLNPQTQQVLFKTQPVDVTPLEYALLARLTALPGETVSRENLLEEMYCQDEAGSNALEVHIHNLRRKLGKTAIKTVRGVGYRLDIEN